MANLAETAQWEDGVYQWETDDPVVGGPDGIDNVPTRQLANRTGYLKTQAEAHATAEDPHPQYLQQSQGNALYDKTGAAAASMAGHVAAGDPHPQYLQQAEGDQLYDKAGVAAVALQAHLNAADPHPQYLTETEAAALIQQGIGQGGTAPQFDNSTKNATTAFVQRALGNFNAYTLITSAATTLTEAQTGGCFLVNAANAEVALPNAAQSNLAYTLYAGAAFTLTTPSGSIIGPNSSSASISVAAHGSIKVVFDGGNWEIIGGSAVAPMTAATQAQFDNSTSLANTAFVLANRGGLGGASTYAAAATMPNSDWGKLIELGSAATAAYSLTLPSLTGGGAYPEMHFTNLGAYNVTLHPASGSIAFLGTGRASVTVYPGMSLHIVSDQGNYIATSASLPQLGNPYQTFTSVAASRVLSTTYYNTTAAPIFVYVTVKNVVDTQLGYYVNGVGASQAWAISENSQIGSVSFIVPPGGSYLVTAVGCIILNWNELR